MNTVLNLQEKEQALGVLSSTLPVVEFARQVWIDMRAVRGLCDTILEEKKKAPGWNTDYHWSDGTLNTAGAVLVMDAWNFCFWPLNGEKKWTVEYRGEKANGYKALALSIKRALEEGIKLYDPQTLKNLTLKDLKHIFRGEGEIPLLKERLQNAHEVGRVLLERWDGDFANLLRACEGSAITLAEMIVENFPSFRDETIYYGREVKFYKRAQILVVDLVGALGDHELVQFHDLAHLTAFADYKIPQVLEAYSVLRYTPHLQAQLERGELLPPGCTTEVEIRAAMVWAVEFVRRELADRGEVFLPHELDWMLWNVGQKPMPEERPYHRTRTIYY